MLKALGKNIIVKPIIEEIESKKSILVIPGKEKKPDFYEVLSVGEEVLTIYAGEHIRIFEYGIKEIGEEGNKIFVVPVENVYAKKIKETTGEMLTL